MKLFQRPESRYEREKRELIEHYRGKWQREMDEHEERNRIHLSNQRQSADGAWEFRSPIGQMVERVADPYRSYLLAEPAWVEAGTWHRAEFDDKTKTATLTPVDDEGDAR